MAALNDLRVFRETDEHNVIVKIIGLRVVG